MHVQPEGKDTARVIWLRILLRVLSVGLLAAVIPWIGLGMMRGHGWMWGLVWDSEPWLWSPSGAS
jgi:hypothetical protein